jgi:hypothetical protein
VRLAAALARTWAYGYEPERGAPFAAEAVAAAAALDDSALLADALDAQLLAHWGPDDLAARVLITARLGEAAAHLPDVEARMSAYLWRLSTALESLDTVTVRRQLRALDDLATESGSDRVRLFADSRAAMHALVVGDVAAADRLRASAVEAGAAAAQADTDAVAHELRAWIARQRGDVPVLVEEAESFEQFGGAQGIASISAQAAVLWVAAGEPGRARAVLHQVAGADFGAVPRDVDWLLTVSGLTEVAAATGAHEPAAAGARLLEPYAGRAVVNSGAVTFAGVVDDVLRQAHAALGHGEAAARWAARAAAGYQRLGASWWLARLELPGTGVAHLVPGVDGVWTVGSAGRQARVRDVKGLHYLRLLLQRPGLPVPALELSAAVAGHTAFEEPGLEVLDRRAVSAYRDASPNSTSHSTTNPTVAAGRRCPPSAECCSTSSARRPGCPAGPGVPVRRRSGPAWRCRSRWPRRSGASARPIPPSAGCCATRCAPGTCACTSRIRRERCVGCCDRRGQNCTDMASRFTRLPPRLAKRNVRRARTELVKKRTVRRPLAGAAVLIVAIRVPPRNTPSTPPPGPTCSRSQ